MGISVSPTSASADAVSILNTSGILSCNWAKKNSTTNTSFDLAVNSTTDKTEVYLLTWCGNANGNVSFEFNGDSTATNYYRQTCTGQGASTGAVNSNSNIIENAGAGVVCSGHAFIAVNATEQRITAWGTMASNTTTNTKLVTFMVISTAAAASITNIKLQAASGFSAQTRFNLYVLRT